MSRKPVTLVKLAGKLPQPKVVTLDGTRADNGGKPYEAVTPTVERLVQAGLSPVSNIHNKRLQVVADPQVGADSVVRTAQAPLQWLASRGMLDDQSPERNRILKEAGERYYRHWFEGGLRGIGAINYDRVGGGSVDPAHQIPISEYAAQHRAEYREARERMGGWLAKVADAVICDELRLADAGAAFGDYASSSTRAAIASTMLKAALTTLAEHFGMLSRARIDRNTSGWV
jgi:hypothetical protein